MRLAKLFKVSLLLVTWLVFGGAYILDVVDQSYEMNAAGSDLEQALEPEDKAGFNGLIVSHADNIETLAFCRCFYTGTTVQQHPRLTRKSPTPPLYQLLSSYRI
jgi:hypothetical protein